MPLQKQKLLLLQRILLTETDEEHGLTLDQIIELLGGWGVKAERKSLYDDVATLRDCGLDVISERRNGHTVYFVGERDFQLPELKLLVDAVQSSKFITRRKSEELIRKLERLTSRHQARQLQRTVYVVDRVKTPNERIYLNVDAIHTAIAQKKMIAFKYYKYNLRKNKVVQNQGQEYLVSPYALTWGEDNYYLICHYPKYGVTHFRVDRIGHIRVVEEKALPVAQATGPEGLDLSQYSSRTFGMYRGPLRDLEVQFAEGLADVVIDRFGDSVRIIDRGDGTFSAHFQARVSPVFFGWLINFGDRTRLLAPADVVRQFADHLRQAARLYD